MIHAILRVLPESTKAVLRSAKSHSPLLSGIAAQKASRELATSSKRLDLCAAQLAHVLHRAAPLTVEGKVCAELGSGWVLTHALVLHLLGAKEIIATDIIPLARPEHLTDAVHRAEASVVRDILSPFCSHSQLRNRLDHLLSIRTFSFAALKELGIEYKAPIDFAAESLGTPVDFVYSHSVLEHVPREDIPRLLENLAADLKPGGTMIHSIHLEDHGDIDGAPFDFLSEPQEHFSRSVQNERGNRVRRSEWLQFFNATSDLTADFLWTWRRRDKALPPTIDNSIVHESEEDLRASHIGVVAQKGYERSGGDR